MLGTNFCGQSASPFSDFSYFLELGIIILRCFLEYRCFKLVEFLEKVVAKQLSINTFDVFLHESRLIEKLLLHFSIVVLLQ